MQEKIIKEIDAIERSKGLRVLLACETGSRAWGFPSPDSDYDVRLLYVHDSSWYATLFEGKDSLEYMSADKVQDLAGWELRKALRLLWKSNAPLLERLQSPIVYRQNEESMDELRTLAHAFYSPVATYHHYSSMCRKLREDLRGDTYSLKRLFYVLRTAACSRWVFEQSHMPPISFAQALDGVPMSSSLRERVEELTLLKSEASEKYIHKGESELLAWVDEMMEYSERHVAGLTGAQGDVRRLDEFLHKTIS